MSLEDAIRYELQRAAVTLPLVGVDLRETVSRGRSIRRRKIAATVVAAAAFIGIVGVGGNALITSSPPPGPRLAPAGEPSDEARPAQAPAATETTPAQAAPRFEQVVPVLREWLSAIQESDEDRAWELMTPEAQAIVGRGEFDRMMQSALPEGLGAFADAQTFHYVVVSTEGGEASAVAVASGDVTREGVTEFAAMAIPMQVGSDRVLVDDPFVGRDRYYDRMATFASASLGPQPYRAGDELVVEFSQPAGAVEVYISVDDDRQPLPTEFEAATGRATATLDRDLEPGRHIATVVVVDSSGRPYPEAIIFEAAQP